MMRAVIFDLYGVLGLNGWQDFKDRHFAAHPEEWEQLRRLGQRADAGKATQAEFVEALVKATGEKGSVIRRQFEQTRANKPLLLYIARELKQNYKIGLLSNTSHDVFESVFSPGELSLFDVAIGSFAVGLTKPDERMFQLICEELGENPSDCVMVDDKPQHLVAAGRLGMKGVLYTSVEQAVREIREALADD